MDTRISTNSSMDGYRDYSKEPVREESGIAAYNASSVHFPTLLHILLSQAEKLGYSHICSWQPHGRAFKIYNREKFVEKMAPLFSKQTRFGSFQRQLNFYGFARISRRGNDHGAYYHELFLRGRPDLCLRLARCKPLDERDRMKRFPPDFYAMEPVVSNKSLQEMASAVATELSMGPSQTPVLSCQNAEIPSTIHSKWKSEHLTSIQEEEIGISSMARNNDVTEGATSTSSWLTDTTGRINPFPSIPLPDAMLMEHYGNQPQVAQKQKSSDLNAMTHRGRQLFSANLSVDSSSESSNYRRCLSFDSGERTTQSSKRSVAFLSSHCGRGHHPGTKSFHELDHSPHDLGVTASTNWQRASDSVGWNSKKHLCGSNDEQKQQFAKLSGEPGLVDTTCGTIGRGATEIGMTSMRLAQDSASPISNKCVQQEKDSALLEDMTSRDIDEMARFLRDVDLEFDEDE